MTLLIASVAADDLATLRKRALAALSAGAGMAELRLDALMHLEPVAVRALCAELPPGGWIATCRPVSEGGAYAGDPEQRLALLASLAGIEAGIIDFEYREWRANPRARQMLSEALQSHPAAPGTPRLIVSQHDFSGRPADVHKLLAEIEAACPQAIAKLAWQSDDAADNLLALDAVRARPGRRVVVCMGAAGLAARVLAGKCGAYATYASAPDAAPTAPGQVSLPDMLDRYRFHLLDRETRVYGVVGDPVQQSVGPAGFNSVFARAAMDAIYLPLLLGPDESAFGRFVEGCLAREWLGFAGASVTHPHKIHALRLAGARIDATARRIGAVNTLVVRDSELWGYNTDYVGAHATFTDVLGVETRAIRAQVLGAGGISRAVVAALVDRGANVQVFARDLARAEWTRQFPNVQAGDWSERGSLGADLIVNCTPIGMPPHIDESPLPESALRPGLTVFETVYNPRETKLLREARRAGCRTIDGVTLFVEQAAAQFELWMEQSADRPLFRAVMEQKLRANF